MIKKMILLFCSVSGFIGIQGMTAPKKDTENKSGNLKSQYLLSDKMSTEEKQKLAALIHFVNNNGVIPNTSSYFE